VPADVAVDRLDRIMKAQAKISLKKNKALIGTRHRVLIDAMEDLTLVGRLQTQAPEIDGSSISPRPRAGPENSSR